MEEEIIKTINVLKGEKNEIISKIKDLQDINQKIFLNNLSSMDEK